MLKIWRGCSIIKTELCDLLEIKYPIIQAGMGPFSTNNLCVAAANAGALGVISSFGMGVGQMIWLSLIEKLFGKGTTEELVKRSIQRTKGSQKNPEECSL